MSFTPKNTNNVNRKQPISNYKTAFTPSRVKHRITINMKACARHDSSDGFCKTTRLI